MRLLALKAYWALGLKDFTRLDTIWTERGPMLLEANSFAGLMCTPKEKPRSYIGFMARAEGKGAKELLDEIVQAAAKRIGGAPVDSHMSPRQPVTKGACGRPRVVGALSKTDVRSLGDPRRANTYSKREAGLHAQSLLIRSSVPNQTEWAFQLAYVGPNTEMSAFWREASGGQAQLQQMDDFPGVLVFAQTPSVYAAAGRCHSFRQYL